MMRRRRRRSPLRRPSVDPADSTADPGPRSSTRRSLRRRHAGRRRPRRKLVIVLCLAVVTLLLPVPWMHVISDDPPGSAWRLNGRLEIEGTIIDPPGRWTWLAVGRPQLVGEVLLESLVGRDDSEVDDLRTGPVGARPALNEPAAVAIGLQHAGHDVELGVLIEVRQPMMEGYPDRGLLASVDGIRLTDADVWHELSGRWSTEPEPRTPLDAGPETTFTLRDGRQLSAPGAGLPYREVRVVPTAPPNLEAGISFEVARNLPIDGIRNLSLGRSHGMIVALMTYAHAAGHDLAQGRHIAGTGGIIGDGTVTPIGSLPAKARAAHRAGADVLLVPEGQAYQLEDVPLGRTQVVPIRTLREAIEWLSQPVT